MDEDLYDEFGNFIGDPSQLGFSEDSEKEVEEYDNIQEVGLREEPMYGDDVEVLIETQDREADRSIIAQNDKPIHGFTNKRIPKALFDRDYLMDLFQIPERQLNIGLYGPLHSGKTAFADMFALDTHQNLPSLSQKVKEGWKTFRYLDQSKLEEMRGVSLKLNGMTFAYSSSRSRTYAVTMLDTPGHVNFWDDVGISLRACELGVIIIDVIEGITSIVAKLLKEMYSNGIPFIIVLNKIDRLILDLKLTPLDAYLKMQSVVDSINTYTHERYSPELGNVMFSSTKFGFVFSIESFVNSFYSYKLKGQSDQLIARLWGQINYRNGSFYQTENLSENIAFIKFILLPIYKVFTHSLSQDPVALKSLILQSFNVTLADDIISKDPQPLLYAVLRSIFPHHCSFIDQIAKLPRNSLQAEANKTLVHVLRHMEYDGELWSLCLIKEGSVKVSQQLYMLDDTIESVEDGVDNDEIPLVTLKKIALLGGRYVLNAEKAVSGQLILMQGFEDNYTKFATLSSDVRSPLPAINYLNQSVFKIALQPQKPSDLPQLLKGLQMANSLYPSLVVKVEESGENVIIGTGELYLDSVMYELRNNFGRIEVKVSSPLVQFTESCRSESFTSIPVKSGNESISISVMAERLDEKIVHDLTHGNLDNSELTNIRKFAKRLRTEYRWDSLAARNCWSLSQCNVFIDDTLPDEVDKALLKKYKQNIIQGFQWATKEGPLADEPIHGCQFKLLDFQIDHSVQSSIVPSQLLPMTRKACYIALMTAAPIILEPIYEVDVLVHGVLQSIVENLFDKRRGARIYRIEKILGSPLIEIKAQIPVIESVGFETDLRMSTNGAGICQLHFWNKIWRKVPGEVLDEEAFIPKLKPAPRSSLSRDFVMKTRRRKGLSQNGHLIQDGPSLKRYVEPSVFEGLMNNGLI